MSINMLLLISIGIVSYVCFSNRTLFSKLLFSPYVIVREKQWYRFLSSAWVHGDYMHLFINVIVLYSFGQMMEQWLTISFGNMGKLMFLGLFVGAVIIAHVPTYLKEKDNYGYSSVGASGGVSGVLFASILIQPLQSLFLFGIIPIPGIVFAIFYMWYSKSMAKKAADNINHDAHIFGAIGGMLILILYKPQVISSFIEQISSIFK